MKHIVECLEFGTNSSISIKDIHRSVNPSKDIILKYLNDDQYKKGIQASLVYDYIEDVQTTIPSSFYIDGDYCWTTKGIYHFDRYDIELSQEFLNYVMSKIS